MSKSFRRVWKKNRTQLLATVLGIIAFTALAFASSQYSDLVGIRTNDGYFPPQDPLYLTCTCQNIFIHPESNKRTLLCPEDVGAAVCYDWLYKFSVIGKDYLDEKAQAECDAYEGNTDYGGYRSDPNARNPSAPKIYEPHGVMQTCYIETGRTTPEPDEPTEPIEPTKPTEPTKPIKPAEPSSPSPDVIACAAEGNGVCMKANISSSSGEGCYVSGGTLTLTLAATSTDEDRKFGSTRIYPVKFHDEGGAYVPYLLRPTYNPWAFFYGVSGRIWIPQIFGDKTYTVRGTVNQDIPRDTVLRWAFDVKTGWGDANTISHEVQVPACDQSEKAYQLPFFGGPKSQQFSAAEWDSMSSQAQEDVKRIVAEEAKLLCDGQAQYLNHCSNVVYNLASGQVKSEQGGPVYNVQRDASGQVRVVNPNEPGIPPADPIRPTCSDVRLCPRNNYKKASCDLTGTYADVPDVQVSRRFSTIGRKENVTISAYSNCAVTCACTADSI